MTGGILPESDAAEPRRLDRIPGVVEVDRVHASGAQRLREVHEHGSKLARVFQRDALEEDLIDLQRGVQIELDPRAVLEHPEPDGVLPADELLLRVDAHVEMVREQIVIGAIRSVLAAQNIGPRRGGGVLGRERPRQANQRK